MSGILPFNRASLAGNEYAYINEAIEKAHISGDGPFTRKCQERLARIVGAGRALLATSCTHALEMSAILLEIGPGDEVIIPSFTFVSTPNAFVLHGATPVFCDIRPDTLNLDERRLEALITPRTKAIVPVHYAGVGCEMEAIMAVAKRYGLAVVEDNAHGLGGRYRGKPLGSFGGLACQSFHETKNITCGEGGALLINDDAFVERAEIVREKGTDRSKFFRGLVDKYSWVDIGSSYVPSDILAAFLYAQLERFDDIQARRRAAWASYAEGLASWAREWGVGLPFIPDHCEQAWHMFYLILPAERDRDSLMAYLRADNIHAVFHYLPLHLSRMGRRYGGEAGRCPVTESISPRLLRLPLYTALTASDIARIVERILAWRPEIT